MINQVIFVPKQNAITYTNRDGEEMQINLQSNRVYKVEMKDGKVHYITVAAVEIDKEPNGKRRIRAGVEFHPGYMNVMKNSNIVLNIDNIVHVETVDVRYEREKRIYNEKNPAPTTDGFTFAFDTNRTPAQYRITVYKGEFLSMAVKYNDATRTYYGHITNVNDTTITILRYVSVNGVRTIRKHIHIMIEELLGIYRYRLTMAPFVPKNSNSVDEKAAANTDNPDGASKDDQECTDCTVESDTPTEN